MVIAIVISVILIIVAFAIIFAIYSVEWDEEEFFKRNKPSYNPSQKSEIKPPNFTPPPAKKKVVHQEDLERLVCKACGAPLNEDLKCEYCGTQWYNSKDKVEPFTYGMSMEEAAEVFTKLSKGVGISGED